MSLRFQIALSQIKGIGPVLAKNLIAYIGNAEGVFRESQANLAKIPDIGIALSKQIKQQQTEALNRADKELFFIHKYNINTVFYTDKDYPYRLKECADSPIILFTKGNISLNESRNIALVGTRDATEYGKELCCNLIKDLAKFVPDATIVSGLAYGIDICAHKASVEVNLPTIGIVGHGLDRLYPAQHRQTTVKMLEMGGLVSEYLSETIPEKQNFVQRNRLIAGLCDAIIVVESAEKGGSLITADMAQSYNRDVFAFPGRVGDTQSAGCNRLISSNKAGLITSASDLIQAMCWEINPEQNTVIQPSLFMELTEIQQIVVGILRKTETLSVNELAIALQMPVSKTSSLLLEMEFNGIVKCLPGNVYKLRP